ncbi:Leucine-rich repeat-containing protein 53 [Microtus ochrogaster]|uniref:Leucine-rich repeat-containing protein 53 n=1 Tax=Microtus ochrogaster TaxID=79684 RepID=A0A8J6G6I3_MICOH|nr:Leucine-rich repeat-containing protein 53 [Microtus ochrogaster]
MGNLLLHKQLCDFYAQPKENCHTLQIQLMNCILLAQRPPILTDGNISKVESTDLTLLVNLALLSLSRTAIYGIQEGSLHGVTTLWTLLLGHNHIPCSLSDHILASCEACRSWC